MTLIFSSLTFSSEKSVVGERNSSTTSDPCASHLEIGCGPCYKTCTSQHQGDSPVDKQATQFRKNNKRSKSKAVQQ